MSKEFESLKLWMQPLRFYLTVGFVFLNGSKYRLHKNRTSFLQVIEHKEIRINFLGWFSEKYS